VRIRAKKCFDALFNFETTSQKVLAIVEQLASAKAQTVFPAPPKHSSSQPE
jgi:hypothetical protein